MIPTPTVQSATPSDAPSSRLAAYLDAELDYVIANFPVISAGFRLTLRRIAVLTGLALLVDENNAQATNAGWRCNRLIEHTLTEWPAVTEEKIAHFTQWYANAVFDLNLTPDERLTLLEL